MKITITTYDSMSENQYMQLKQSIFNKLDEIILSGFKPSKENVYKCGGVGDCIICNLPSAQGNIMYSYHFSYDE